MSEGGGPLRQVVRVESLVRGCLLGPREIKPIRAVPSRHEPRRDVLPFRAGRPEVHQIAGQSLKRKYPASKGRFFPSWRESVGGLC